MTKKLNMYVWNNFDNDDRVKKKATTLSKEFDINVYCVCKKPQTKSIKYFTKNIKVHYFWYTDFLFWLWIRTIGNYWFWKKVIYTTEYSGCEVVDCNDPDTLWAGVIIKNLNRNVKLIYDSHEYWKGTKRKEYNWNYTLYSYIVNHYQYLVEKFLVKNVDRIVCVSDKIKEKLVSAYHKPVDVIMNISSYNNYSCSAKSKKLCFFGSKPRLGLIKIGANFKKNNVTPVMIGSNINNKYWTDLGYMKKDEFQKEMSKCMYGLCVFDVTCDNIRYCMPNKLFEYIQAELPVIVNKDLECVSKFVEDNNIGVVIKDDSDFTLAVARFKLKLNYDEFLTNIKKLKKTMCWKNQENKLLNIYKEELK